MPEYGYGESSSKQRRRERKDDVDTGKKEKKEEKKEKKQHRESREAEESRDRKRSRTDRGDRDRDRDDGRDGRRSSGRGGKVSATSPSPAAAAAAEEATLGRSLSKGDAFGEVQKQKSAWRKEMDKRHEEEEAPADGIVPMEDDESVEKMLAESRARREALMAQWVNKGEPNGMGTLEDAAGDAESEVESDREEGEIPPPAADEPDAETLKKHKDLMRFIIQHKAEHDDDMFLENADEDALKAARQGQSAAIGQTGASADDWDDQEGYYRAKIGEVMDNRYLVVEDMCGKGVFSNVVKAKDQQDGSMVAIKVMRCNDMMRAAAEKEVEVLQKLSRADRANKKHVIKMIRSFTYRGHLCLVFECMWDNLRVALKKYTKDKGMSLQAVRAYTKQLLIALRHIHRCNIIHADIKPDNILISAGHNIVKICDLGSAFDLSETDITPYLVSRFYRAPEIILGLKYGFALDVFAMGSTLYELFTGKIMFPGRTNNDMLRLFMELKGKIPHKTIKAGQLWKQHFDEKNLDFKFIDTDKATKKKVLRVISDCSAKKSILDAVLQRVGVEKQRSTEQDDILYVKKAKQFADLLGQMTTLDPEKRVTPNDALQHPFLAEAGPGSTSKQGGQEGGGGGKGGGKKR